MALKNNKKIRVHGRELTFDDSYTRIERVEGNKKELTITVCTYDDDTLSKLISTEFYKFEPNEDEESVRWDKQGYEYLKTLSQYDDAVNC